MAAAKWYAENPSSRARVNKKYSEKHRAEINAKRRATRANNLAVVANQKRIARKHALKKYGLSESDFIEKLKSQKSLCAICEKEISEKSAVVDHCHTTGKTRDLLCRGCNFSLGHIERAGFLEAALAYSERHRSWS
jgi:hypothetical protein